MGHTGQQVLIPHRVRLPRHLDRRRRRARVAAVHLLVAPAHRLAHRIAQVRAGADQRVRRPYGAGDGPQGGEEASREAAPRGGGHFGVRPGGGSVLRVVPVGGRGAVEEIVVAARANAR